MPTINTYTKGMSQDRGEPINRGQASYAGIERGGISAYTALKFLTPDPWAMVILPDCPGAILRQV